MLKSKFLFFLFFVIIFSSCSYEIIRYGYDVNINTDTSFKNNVLIKNQVHMYGIDAQYFKLSQISALRLQKYINQQKINAGRTQKITEIFNQYNKKYWKKIDSFMVATNFGKDTTEFKKLKKQIDNQYKLINEK